MLKNSSIYSEVSVTGGTTPAGSSTLFFFFSSPLPFTSPFIPQLHARPHCWEPAAVTPRAGCQRPGSAAPHRSQGLALGACDSGSEMEGWLRAQGSE